MASAIVRAALTSTVNKTPSLSLRSSAMKKAEEILTKASVEEETDKFSEGMLKYLTEEVRNVISVLARKENIYGVCSIR